MQILAGSAADFDVDSFSCFLLESEKTKKQTNAHTQLIALPTRLLVTLVYEDEVHILNVHTTERYYT